MDPLSVISPILLQSGIFGDFELLLKVVGLLFIISFVRSHIQHPILSTVLILGISAFLLFDVWKLFGGILLLYLLFFFGFAHVLVDLSFMSAFTSPLLNIGGLFRGKPKRAPQQGAYHEGQHPGHEEMEHDHHREHERGEHEYEREEYGDERGGYEPEESRHSMSREEMEQRVRYERAMQQRMRQRGGKDDEHRR